VEPTKLTFGEYLLRWIDDYCRLNQAPSTFDSYQRIIKKHVIPALGAISLAKLQPMHLQGYYSEKLGILSQRTVQYHHRVIREALNHAVKWQLIPRNVADAVQAPRAKRPEISVPGLQEIQRLLEAAHLCPYMHGHIHRHAQG
jgi:integrase